MTHLFITAPGGQDGVLEQCRKVGVVTKLKRGEFGLPTEDELRVTLLKAVEDGLLEYREILAKRANAKEVSSVSLL